MLPQVTLTGSSATKRWCAAVCSRPDRVCGASAGGLTAPIFEGGTLRAKRRAAIDLYDQAAAQYRLTVLNAFQNVADTLTALDNDAQALRRRTDAVSAANRASDLIQRPVRCRCGQLRDLANRAAGVSAGAHRLRARPVEPLHRHRHACSRRWEAAGGTATTGRRPRRRRGSSARRGAQCAGKPPARASIRRR